MKTIKLLTIVAVIAFSGVFAINWISNNEPDFTDAYRDCMSNAVSANKMPIESAGVICRKDHQNRRAEWLKAHPAGRLNPANN